MRRLAALCAVFALAGCHRHTSEAGDTAGGLAPGRGVRTGTASSPLPSPPPPLRAPIGASRARYVDPSPAVAPGSWRARGVVPPRDVPITVTQRVAAPAPRPSRDLSGELRALAGDPTSCVPPEAMATLPEHVHLSLSATVSVSGIVTSAEASGNLTPAALICVRHRLEHASFAGDVDGAPRTVHATADFDRAPRPTTP